MLILLAAGAIWWLTHREMGTLRWIMGRIRHKDQMVKDLPGESADSLAPGGSEHILAGDK
jgi:hypothetical protein